MNYVGTLRIPVAKPDRRGLIFSEECALKILEDMKERYQHIESIWANGDLIIKVSMEKKNENR